MNLTRTWIINGEARTVEFPPMRRLLDVLREDLGLKGTKEGCGEGECGACSVLLNGEVVTSCLVAAGQVEDGATDSDRGGSGEDRGWPRTAAGLHRKGRGPVRFLHPGHDWSLPMPICPSGQPDLTDLAMRDAHAGNICRCTGYAKIMEAVAAAAERWPKGGRNP
jgi:carbon-monoxide dehydrogenase small subunit